MSTICKKNLDVEYKDIFKMIFDFMAFFLILIIIIST